MRVASLLPSATELLCRLGADFSGDAPGERVVSGGGPRPSAGAAMLVGRSHECDYPPGIEHVVVLTGPRTSPGLSASAIDSAVREQLREGAGSLYTLDIDRLLALEPDLILTQDLCRVCSIDLPAVQRAVAGLPAGRRPEMLSLHPTTVEDVLDDLLRIGRAVGLEGEATRAVVELRERMFAAADFVPAFAPRPVVAVLEWTDPLYIAGHWTPQLVERAGGEHPLNPTAPVEQAGAAAGPMQSERRAGRSVRIPAEALVAAGPEYLVICPCGVGLDEAERMTHELSGQSWWEELPAVRAARRGEARVAIVDGNQMFNRPGPRLIDALEWLVGWLNDRPGVVLPGFPWRMWEGTRALGHGGTR